MPPRKQNKKSKRPARRGRRYAPRRKMTNVADYAGRSEVRDLINPNPLPPPIPPNVFAPAIVYRIRDITLDQFDAAVSIAKAYQFYRIKHVTLKFMPLFDTFTAGGPSTIPRLYYMIDKSGSIPTNVTIPALKKMGAKPIRFDERQITRGWSPSVLTADTAAPGVLQSSQYKVSPWLSTNANVLNPGAWVPSSIDHLGCFFVVEQEAGATANYRVELTVEFQFKKPLWTLDLAPGEESLPVSYTLLPTNAVTQNN